MITKKAYSKPILRSEKMEIGVFGCYGRGGDDGWQNLFGLTFLAKFVRSCCKN